MLTHRVWRADAERVSVVLTLGWCVWRADTAGVWLADARRVCGVLTQGGRVAWQVISSFRSKLSAKDKELLDKVRLLPYHEWNIYIYIYIYIYIRAFERESDNRLRSLGPCASQ